LLILSVMKLSGFYETMPTGIGIVPVC